MAKKLFINTKWCKGCGICVEFCPRKVLYLENEKVAVKDSGCSLCGLCELRCPDYAIYVEEVQNEQK